ncbi:MAG TPA: hypothetical protein VIU40_10730 [Geobacteraceae bacterium]
MVKKMFLLLLVMLPLTGCGIDWFPDGTKPNAFSFATKTDVQRNTPVESETVTISGNSYATDISVVNGEYKIGDGAFTSAPGKISAGQTVTVKHTSATGYSTATTTILVIGGVRASFTSVTIAAPATSNVNDFAFATKTGVELSTVVESDPVTITGTNAPWPITVSNGEYSLDSGVTWTAAAGSVADQQTVKVRHTSSAAYSTTTTTTLTVDTRSVGFSSITRAAPAPFTNFSTVPPLTFVGTVGFVAVTSITAQGTLSGDTMNFGVTLIATNIDTSSSHTIQAQLMGLDSQGRKIHPGYFPVTVAIGPGLVDQTITVANVGSMPATTFNSITRWVFRTMTVN